MCSNGNQHSQNWLLCEVAVEDCADLFDCLGGDQCSPSTVHDSTGMQKDLENWQSLPVIPRGPGGDEDERDFRKWDFNIWLLDVEELLPLSMHIVASFGFYKSFSLDTHTFCAYISEVQRLMGTYVNPYHNYRHIMDVTQSVACIVDEFEASTWLSDLEIFSLIMSAVVHDLEHPGTNNAYQVNAETPLAIRYNDISVLENHHCAKAFEVMAATGCNIVSGLTPTERKGFRKNVIALVLNTDMMHHFVLRAELDAVVKRNITDAPPRKASDPFTRMDEKDLLVVMKSILHTADISNPAKRWTVSRKWSDLVCEEFFLQGDREKRENFPVSMNCDRDTVRQDELSMNFADFIVAPFFFSMTTLLPKMMRCCKILGTNRSNWNDMYMTRSDDSDPVVKEAMGKWAARHAGFEEKLCALEDSIIHPSS